MPFAEMELAAEAVMPQAAPVPGTYFAADAAAHNLFTANFDHKPFEFRHKMHTLPAFSLQGLMEAAQRISQDPAKAGKSHFESGDPDRNAWFGSRPEGETLVHALESIQSGKNWVILKRIHEDKVYRDVLMDLIPELSELSGVDMADTYYDPTMTIFITSPGRVTPYHMDGETNFLAQIHGTKMCYIYDGHDHSVLSPEQLEKYWTGNLPKIDYPASLPYGHWQWQLKPGTGVFNPAIFPHWLENGKDVSISVSMNFKRRNNAVIGAQRANHFLRKMGLAPTEPGKNSALDRTKEVLFGRAYEAAKSMKHK